MLADAKTTLLTIPTTAIMETNELVYPISTVILEILLHEFENATCREYPCGEDSWKLRTTKPGGMSAGKWKCIMVSQETDLGWKKCNRMLMSKALETAKHRQTSLTPTWTGFQHWKLPHYH